MPRKVNRDVLVDFVHEVQGSLEPIAAGVAAYRARRDAEALAESHRLTHSAKGAAALVGLPTLSFVAAWQEELIEAAADAKDPLPWLEAVDEMLPVLARFLDGLLGGSLDECGVFAAAFAVVRPRFELPEDDLGRLWDQHGNSEAVRLLLSAAAPSAVPSAAPSAADGLNEGGEEPPAAAAAVAAVPETADIEPIDLTEFDRIAPELREVFAEEAEDHLKTLFASLQPLEKDREDRAALHRLRRAAHTLKGAAGAVGLRTVTRLAHRMEDFLDAAHARQVTLSGESVALLYATTDALQDLIAGQFDADALGRRVATMLARYDAELAGVSADDEDETTSESHGSQGDSASEERQSSASSALRAPQSALRTQGPDAPRSEVHAEVLNPAETAAASGRVLRVPLEKVDDVVRLVGELMITRTSFEQRMGDLFGSVGELQLTLDRLRRIAAELETRYAVGALGGRFDFLPPQAGDDGAALPAGPKGPGIGHGIGQRAYRIAHSRLDEFDSLEFDRYTEFHLLARSLSEATSDVSTIASELRTVMGEFDTLLTRQTRLSRETQDKLMRVRMVPLATLGQQLHRAVRSVAEQEGKQIDFVLDGEHVELDKHVLERLADPLGHLLRNAADHGVESPAVREALGKPATATVRVAAAHQGAEVVLRVSDDGAGIDPEGLRSAVVHSEFLSSAEAAALSDAELLQCIFLPGFSTAAEVNEVSGRGIGLDVVRDTVQGLKGSVHVESTPGEGTTFVIRLPLTLAVTRALLVSVRGETFALPAQPVRQILRVGDALTERLGGERTLQSHDGPAPLKDLAEHLGLDAGRPEGGAKGKGNGKDPRAGSTAIVLQMNGRRVAWAVDGVLAARDVVVKSLGNHLRPVRGLIGATLLGDGSVVPILDPSALVGETVVPARVRRRRAPGGGGRELRVMVVDDSVSVRRVMCNLIKQAGWVPLAAKDGLHALELLQATDRAPDAFLLDIEMPRMDGYELLGWLRRQDAYRNVPVVMVTSRAGQKHRSKAVGLGASGYVVKPYQDETLLNLVRELVRQRGGQPAPPVAASVIDE